MKAKLCYLMRGLPACGKSFTARQLAGATGIVCETDEYFYTQVGDDPTQYNYSEALLDDARRWNFNRFTAAIDRGLGPVVVDRGNGVSLESRAYARYAAERGYHVALVEPQSPWWREIRSLLVQKERNRAALQRWARTLAEKSRSTHRVPYDTIFRWMMRWRCDITIEDILRYEPSTSAAA